MSDRVCTVALDRSSDILIYKLDTDSSELRRELLPKGSKALCELLEKHPPFCGVVTTYRPALGGCLAATWVEEGPGCLSRDHVYGLNGKLYQSKSDFLEALVKDKRAKPLLDYFIKRWEI